MAVSDIKTRWKPVKPWVEPVVYEICENRKIYFVWGKSSGTSGEHPLGRALDFSVLEYGNGVPDPGPARPALGEDIANYLWKHRKRLNIWYVIWNRRIISTNPDSYAYNEWTKYRGSNPHTDHVHVSFNKSGTYEPPEDDMPSAKEVAHAVLYSDVIENVGNKENPKMTLAGAITNLEETQDKHGKELAEIKKQLAEILAKLQG